MRNTDYIGSAMRCTTVFLFLGLLSACQSTDGRYVPGCAAFEGDTIELRNSRYTWSRFTDEVRVDESGNKIDPFPGFPKTGTYVRSGKKIELNVERGDTPLSYYLLPLDGETYLLTAAEQGRYTVDNVVERCALRRETDSK